jgi:hypothetical protein
LRADFLACCWAVAEVEVVVMVDVEVVSFCRAEFGTVVAGGGVAEGVHATVDNKQRMNICCMFLRVTCRFYLQMEQRRD